MKTYNPNFTSEERQVLTETLFAIMRNHQSQLAIRDPIVMLTVDLAGDNLTQVDMDNLRHILEQILSGPVSLELRTQYETCLRKLELAFN